MNKKVIIIAIILLIILVISSLLFYYSKLYFVKGEEIRDLSNIKIPNYQLPEGYKLKDEIENIAISFSKSESLSSPTNMQILLLKFGDYIKHFSQGEIAETIPDDTLIYYVCIDIKRLPEETHIKFPASVWVKIEKYPAIKEKFTMYQDVYIFDAKTGEVLGFGYHHLKLILPKQ